MRTLFLSILSVFFLAASSFSAVVIVAQDDAANEPYASDGDWNNGQDGGTGFGAWSIGGEVESWAGTYIGSDLGGASWAAWARSGNTLIYDRDFDATMAYGYHFTIDWKNTSINNGDIGFALVDSWDADIFQFHHGSGQETYYIWYNGSWHDTGYNFTTDDLVIDFHFLSGDTFDMTINSTTVASGAQLSGGFIGNFRGWNYHQGDSQNYQINDMKIWYNDGSSSVPEPTTMAMTGVAVFLLMAVRCKKLKKAAA